MMQVNRAVDKRISQRNQQHLMSGSLQIATQPAGVITDAITPRLQRSAQKRDLHDGDAAASSNLASTSSRNHSD